MDGLKLYYWNFYIFKLVVVLIMIIINVFLDCLCLIDEIIKRDVNIYIKMFFVFLFGLLSLKLCMCLF